MKKIQAPDFFDAGSAAFSLIRVVAAVMTARGFDTPTGDLVSPFRGLPVSRIGSHFRAGFAVDQPDGQWISGVFIDVEKRGSAARCHAPIFAPFADRQDYFSKIFAGWCQHVFKAGRAGLIDLFADQPFFRQSIESVCQNVGGDAQGSEQLVKSAQAEQQITHDEHAPAVAKHGHCGGNRAVFLVFFGVGPFFRGLGFHAVSLPSFQSKGDADLSGCYPRQIC